MTLKWSSQRTIANSRIVKTSVIWLFIVPFVAKLLSTIDDVIQLTIFEGSISISTVLPFSWQLLFFAAISFTIAGIIYSIACPEIVKNYENHAQFESDGKTRLQINSALKDMAWDQSDKKFKEKYVSFVKKYLQTYSKLPLQYSDENLNKDGVSLLENISDIEGKNSNAFYYVYELSDTHGQPWIWSSLIFYVVGFICFTIIGIQNILYVVETFG
ncbi:hypothetical protein GHNINEIG_01165 [Hydrogenovibrio crunogenus]|uniref:Uncharacterized protein n=1 Tax=Hydrogenovibrio crunogenus TaxID=39765 RepID=A0A4V1C8U5_9GAMM|nr:hypothetical protein [Hydrogenovibrio crunogenus]QBZ83124.1 hypothetical protein GHNINEIG_01165 [Hydrogenovibrio crunogenus]